MRRRMAQHSDMEAISNQGAGPAAKQSDFRHEGQSTGMGGGMGGDRGGSLRDMGGVGFLLRNAQELNLTDSQQASLNKLRTRFEIEKIDKLAALDKAKIAFRALIRDPQAAERDVLAAIDKVSACEADLRKMRYHHLKAAQAELDANQLAGVTKKSLRARLGGGGDNS